MKKKQIIAGIVLVIFCGLIVICVIKNRKSAVQNVDNQNTSEGQIVEINGELVYEKDGTPLLSETGIHFYEGQWRYIENGVWRNDVTGLLLVMEVSITYKMDWRIGPQHLSGRMIPGISSITVK